MEKNTDFVLLEDGKDMKTPRERQLRNATIEWLIKEGESEETIAKFVNRTCNCMGDRTEPEYFYYGEILLTYGYMSRFAFQYGPEVFCHPRKGGCGAQHIYEPQSTASPANYKRVQKPRPRIRKKHYRRRRTP
jgi:hypothetical protein